MLITSLSQVKNPEFVRLVRNYSSRLAERERIKPCTWLDTITDYYRDLEVLVVDQSGEEIFLDMEVFEVDCIEFWFRDFCRPVPGHVVPRVRFNAHGRVVALSTILRGRNPLKTNDWEEHR